MVDCLSWYSCYGKEKRSISKIQRIINKSNLNCGGSDRQSKRKQQNTNNNNNISSPTSDEQNALLHFYLFDISRERNLHLNTNSYDKRLLIFSNISNSLYKIGLRNGDILIYFNETNILKPPVSLTIDRVKSEFTALRRQNKSIHIGICRYTDQCLLNNTTIKHLSSLTYDELKNLSQNNEIISTRKSPVNSESKKIFNLFSSKKRNSIRDSGFVETDNTDHSLISNSNEKEKSLEMSSHQIITDACFIYRREIIKPPTSNAMIVRGREIAYEAANSPTIPSSMPNYTDDQVRELYGELDKKTRRLQENEYILHTPLIDAWKEKQCPLPKFRLENTDQTIVMTAYLSTGLSNKPSSTFIPSNEKEIIRGSFRTAIDDRTTITPSPLLFNVHLDLNQLLPPLANTSETMDIDSLIDLDEETVVPEQTEAFDLINNEDRSLNETDLSMEKFSEENAYQEIHDDFEELYQRYMKNLDQYETILEKLDQFDMKQEEEALTPINEEPDKQNCLTLTVERQSNHIGHYGFEIEQTFDGKIRISSIINSIYCPNLNVGDEIIHINNHLILKTLEQCHLLFHSLWYKNYDTIQITIRKVTNLPNISPFEPMSLQSSSLSWPLSIIESDFLIEPNSNIKMSYEDEFSRTSASSYRSQITPRSTNVQRRAGGTSGIMTRMYQSYSSSGGSGGFATGGGISGLASIAGLGSFSGIPLRPNRGTTALVAVNETREREKRELCQLNDKFAQYVEKVRFLEAQNRKLQLELEALQNKAGQGSSKIKEMYEVEMHEAKKLIDDTTRDRAAAEVKARDAEKEALRYRKRYEEILNSRETDRSAIDRLQQQIAENEAQINLFRRRLADLEDEARRYKAETQRLASEIARLQNEIQNETFVKSSLDTEKMALEDELAMLKQMHEADLNELRSKTVVDVSLDPSHFFRNELAQAIRDIRNEFEALNEQQRSDLHNRYMMSYNELILRHQKPDLDPIQSEQQRIQEEKLRTTLLTTRNEVAHMKARNEELNNRIRELQLHISQERDEGGRIIQRRAAEIEELRVKLLQLQKEYEEVTNMKTSLEKEINTYRELLEGTNNREGLKQIVDHVVEEARRIETERTGTTSSIAYSGGGGGRSTTIQRTFISSSGSGASSSGVGGLIGSAVRTGSSYSASQGGGGASYSYSSTRRE